jgi:SAM-dependent methyltransferase
MERKKYMAEVYSHYWISRRRDLGFLKYDMNLCRFIESLVAPSSRLLEVAIGTGYPFADYLQKRGYVESGVDIAPVLIDECRKMNPAIDGRVGDAENLPFADDVFDGTYCFHSTWYFPDLRRALGEMVRVTRPSGLIIFDIQNRHEASIAKAYRKIQFEQSLIGTPYRFSKNIAKIILRRGVPDWHHCVEAEPSDPEMVHRLLTDLNVSDIKVKAKTDSDSLLPLPGIGPYPNFYKLIFVVKK